MATATTAANVDQLAVNAIRALSIDAVQQANSGHPGLPLDEIKHFRQWGSKTPGHPEYRLTPGVELTTGPLGQGLANGIGLAVAEAHLAATYNRGQHEIVDHHTFGIVSDGDLMEGVAYEAASIAGHLRLGKVVYLYNSNQVTLAGSTGLVFSADVAERFEAMEWHVVQV